MRCSTTASSRTAFRPPFSHRRDRGARRRNLAVANGRFLHATVSGQPSSAIVTSGRQSSTNPKRARQSSKGGTRPSEHVIEGRSAAVAIENETPRETLVSTYRRTRRASGAVGLSQGPRWLSARTAYHRCRCVTLAIASILSVLLVLSDTITTARARTPTAVKRRPGIAECPDAWLDGQTDGVSPVSEVRSTARGQSSGVWARCRRGRVSVDERGGGER